MPIPALYRDWETPRKDGITSSILSGEAKEALQFIENFIIDYKLPPSSSVVLGRTGVRLLDVSEPSDFYIAEFKNLRLFNILQEELSKCITLQGERKPYKTVEAMEKALIRIKETSLTTSKIEEMYELGLRDWETDRKSVV